MEPVRLGVAQVVERVHGRIDQAETRQAEQEDDGRRKMCLLAARANGTGSRTKTFLTQSCGRASRTRSMNMRLLADSCRRRLQSPNFRRARFQSATGVASYNSVMNLSIARTAKRALPWRMPVFAIVGTCRDSRPPLEARLRTCLARTVPRSRLQGPTIGRPCPLRRFRAKLPGPLQIRYPARAGHLRSRTLAALARYR